MKKLITLKIDRRKWLRGETDSLLLRSTDKKMCCLGFLALEAGYTRKQIKSISTPENLVDAFGNVKGVFKKLVERVEDSYDNSNTACELMHINDEHDISEEQREFDLTEEFRMIGVKVIFTN